MIKKIKKIFAPPEFQNKELTRRAKTMYRLLIVVALIIIIDEIIHSIINPAFINRWLGTAIVFAIVTLILLILNRKGYYRIVALLLSIFAIGLTTVMSWNSGGIYSPVVHYFPVIIIITGFLLGWKEGNIAGIAIIIITLAFIVAGLLKILPENYSTYGHIGIWVTLTTSIVLLMLFLYLIIAKMDNALVKANMELNLRKKAEEDLRKNKAFSMRVFDGSRIPIILMDAETRKYIDCNKAAVALFHLKNKGEIIGKDTSYFSPAFQNDDSNSKEKESYYLNKAIEEGTVTYEWKYQWTNGELWDAEINLMGLISDNHQLLQFAVRDITEQKKAEASLKASELLIKSISDNLIEGIIYQTIAAPDNKTKFTYLSDSVRSIYGLSPEEAMANPMSFFDAIHPDDKKSFFKAREVAQKNLSVFKAKARVKTKSGDYRWFSFISNPRKLNDGSICWDGIQLDITDIKLTEENLRKSEERYRFISEHTVDFIWALSLKTGKFTYMSNAIEKILSYSPGEAPAIGLSDILTPRSFEKATKNFEERIFEHKTGNNRRLNSTNEYEYVQKDGSLITTEVTSTIIFNEEDIATEIIGVTRDITERKKTEEALLKEISLNKTLINASPAFIVAITSDGKTLAMNPSMLHALGYTSEEITGKDYLETFVLTEDHPEVSKIFEKILCEHASTVNENRIKTKTNKILDVEWHGTYVNSPDNINYFIGVGIDITERKIAEEKIRKSEKRLKTLLSSVTDYVYTVKVENGVATETIHGDGCLAVTGYIPESFDRDQYLWYNIIFDEDKRYVLRQISKLLNNKDIKPFEHRIIHKNKKIQWVRNTIVPKRDLNGELISYDGLIVNITNQKLAEEKLIESEKKYRNLFENANDAIFILKDNRYIDCNLNSVALLEIPKKKIITSTLWEVSPPVQSDGKPSKEKALKHLGKALKGTPQRFEWQHICADSTIIDTEVSINKFEIPGEDFLLAVVRDISDRKRFEKEVYISTFKGEENERSRMAKELHDGLGPLISACKIYHHNLNQLKFNDDDLESYKRLGGLLDESMSTIREISNNLSPHILRNFGVTDAIKNFIGKLKTSLKFEIINNYDTNQRFSEVIEVTLYRVLIELINNTLKYAKAKNVLIVLSKENNEFHARYKDDGIGFNYKEDSISNGFGLLNIYSRIKSIGGNIVYKSKKNKGVEVEIAINL